MNKDIPVGEILVTENDFYCFTPISTDIRDYPFDMQEEQNAETFRRFIDYRITPPTRQGLNEILHAHGIERYNVAAILIASNGRDCSDPFWIKFPTGPQTWKDVWAAIGVYNKP